jgi:hypothetical protein
LSNQDSYAGIGLVHYVHSLVGLAETTIFNRDVDNQSQCMIGSWTSHLCPRLHL